jgi:polyisoprenoid-binding protein YceI
MPVRGVVATPFYKEPLLTFRTLSFTTALVLASAVAYAQAPPPATAATPAPQGPPPPQPTLGPNQWRIDSNHSTAAFSVTHLMVSTVRGAFGKVSGLITYDGKDISTLNADVTIDAASISTNNERRDADLRSPNFFDVANHPTLTFNSKKATAAGAGKFKLVGDLTMHGVTKEVTLDGEGPTPAVNAGRNSPAGDRMVTGATATVTINRSEWGLTWNRALEAGGVTVSDAVKIMLEIEANKPNPNAPPPPPRPGQ